MIYSFLTHFISSEGGFIGETSLYMCVCCYFRYWTIL